MVKKIYISLSLLIIVFLFFSLINNSFGTSSFVNQQIEDGKTKDSKIMPPVTENKTLNKELLKYCSFILYNKELVPEILEAAYISDGETLNATLWLTNSSETNLTLANIGRNAYLSDSVLPNLTHNITDIIVFYEMIIDVISVYDEHTDYSVSIEWDNKTGKWYENFKQLSKDEEKHKIIKSLPFTKFFKPEVNDTTDKIDYISFSLDLKQINYPSDYKIMFRAYSYINTSRGISCSSQDFTDRAAVPPPKYDISVEPASLTLQPSQKGEINIKVNSSTNLNSRLIFSQIGSIKGLNLTFIPSEISLPAKGKATTTLLVNSINNYKLNNIIPIKAEVIFNQTFKYTSPSQQQTTELSHNTGISLMTFPQVIVIEPTPINEQISGIFTTSSLWLQNFGGLIGTLGTIGTGIIAFIAFIGKVIGNKIRNKDKKNQINNIKISSDINDNQSRKNGAPF